MYSRFAKCIGAISLFLISFAGLIAPAGANEPLPLSEYGKLPDIERSAISPSGDRVALITTIQGKRVILAIENQTKPIKMVTVGNLKIRSLRWIGEERLLLVSSQTEDLYGFTTDKAEFSIGRVVPISDDEEGGLIFGGMPKYVDSIIGNYGIRKIKGRYYGFFGGIELSRDRAGSRAATVLITAGPICSKSTFRISRWKKSPMPRAKDLARTGWWMPRAKSPSRLTSITPPARGISAMRREKRL